MNDTITQFNEKTTEEYLRSPYHCPYCKDDKDIEWGELIPHDESSIRTSFCNKCKQKWDEIQTVTGVEPTPS